MLNKIEKNIQINQSEPTIVLSGHNWHGGIIGIIASRLKEKYNKPTIIISVENGLGRASARSVLGFDIGALIIKAHQKNLIKKGGGHKMAGGFSLQEEKISEFKDFINLEFSKIEKKINILGKLSLNEWKGQRKVEFIIDDISVNKANIN